MSSNKTNDENMFSVGEVFCNDTYVIPIYQRNYDWGDEQIRQLIQDVFDHAQQNKDEQNKSKYYIGSLVVWKRGETGPYEVVDGQQRLTTLLILLTVLWQHNTPVPQPNAQKLTFEESRAHASATLATLCATKDVKDVSVLPENYSVSMYEAYQSMMGLLRSIIQEHGAGEQSDEDTQIRDFCTYLLNDVHIFRVTLPEKTDLNHYFEVMNNRGEQLEQHEVVKANLLSALNDDNSRNIFNMIWNKCANMNQYIQEQFKGKDVFDANGMLMIESAEKLFENLSGTANKSDADTAPQDKPTLTLKEATDSADENGNAEQPEHSDRFEAVINFPNFLMHALRLHVLSKQNMSALSQEDMRTLAANFPLDDKRIQKTYEAHLKPYKTHLEKQKDPAEQEKAKSILTKSVLELIYDILKYRFLLDTYVVKRVSDSGEWKFELKRAKRTDRNTYYAVRTFGPDEEDEQRDQIAENPEHTALNTQAMMLLSMFHVNTPSQNYKNWLSGALHYLARVYSPHSVERAKSVDPLDYVRHLERLAYAFFKRSVTDNAPAYEDIIYKETVDVSVLSDNITEKLNHGTGVPHYIFYYLDYLLWHKKTETDGKKKYRDFQFTIRTSVEHWLPQHPLQGTHEDAARKRLHHFGNLGLISRGQNSRLSNHSPQDKAQHTRNANKRTTSCKLREMAAIALKKWGANEIDTHGTEMQNLLLTPPQ